MAEMYRYRALVVDDEEAIRDLLVRALIREGFRCDVACDGREARQRGQLARYDAVVTDLRMPRENGHQLALHFLESKDRPTVVVLTGVLEPVITKDLLVRGVDDVMFKPVDHAAFAAKVKALVERRLLMRAQADGKNGEAGSTAVADADGKDDPSKTGNDLGEFTPDALPPGGEAAVSDGTSQQTGHEIDEVSEPVSEPVRKGVSDYPFRSGLSGPRSLAHDPNGPPADSTDRPQTRGSAGGTDPRDVRPPELATAAQCPRKTRHRLVKWSTRLALPLLLAVWLGGHAIFAYQQNRAIETIERLGAHIIHGETGGVAVDFTGGDVLGALAELSRLRHLDALKLDRTNVTDRELRYLRGLTQLRELSLAHTTVGDAGLENLAALILLSSLNLRGTEVTDAGLEHLKKLTGLETLDLSDTEVTEQGVQSIQQTLPDVRVKR